MAEVKFEECHCYDLSRTSQTGGELGLEVCQRVRAMRQNY